MQNEKNKNVLCLLIDIVILLLLLFAIGFLFTIAYESMGILLTNKINSLNNNWLSIFYYGSFIIIVCLTFFAIKNIKMIICNIRKIFNKTPLKEIKINNITDNKILVGLSVSISLLLIGILTYFTTIFLKNIIAQKIDVFISYTNLILAFIFIVLSTILLFLLGYIILNILKKLNKDSTYTFNNSSFVLICMIVIFAISIIFIFFSLKMHDEFYPSINNEFNGDYSSMYTYILLTFFSTIVFNLEGYLVYRFILNMTRINAEELSSK